MGVYHNEIFIRIGFPDIVSHFFGVGIGLSVGGPVHCMVFLPQVPGEGKVMGESGNQFPEIQFSLYIQVSRIEQTFILRFLEYNMFHNTQLVSMREDDFPLVKFAAIKTGAFIAIGIRPHIFPIAQNIQGKKINTVHAFG
jgi:hypothetical protein